MRFLLVFAALALSAGVWAQAADSGLKEYKSMMKAAAKADDQLKSALDEENVTAVRTAAEGLSLSMSEMATFWTARGASDATEWATRIQRASDEIAAKAEAADFAAARAGLGEIRTSCDSCHKTHRKMSLRGWKFK